MNLGSRRLRDDPELNLTSLIDVVFTLIIFFVVTTTFDQRSAIQLDLPKADATAQVSPPQSLVVAIDASGRYFVGNAEVLKPDAASLRAAIEQVAGEQREQPVILRADAKSAHQSVVTAMQVLGDLGFAKVSIATVSADAAD